MTNSPDNLIISAASKSYGAALLALLGSLNLNWRDHPPVLVYDLGMDQATLAVLHENKIPVKPVPPFCPHWRKHFTWKIWAWNDAPAQNILWLDAGLVVLKPLDDIFSRLLTQDFFVVRTGYPLEVCASREACAGCGVALDFRKDKETLAGGLMAFYKSQRMRAVLELALRAALDEPAIAATEPMHRCDQALLSLELYKEFGVLEIDDDRIYLEWKSPRVSGAQKVWVHRRTLEVRDQKHLTAHISKPGAPFLPHTPFHWQRYLPLYRLRRWLGARDARYIYNGVRD